MNFAKFIDAPRRILGSFLDWTNIESMQFVALTT